MIALDASAAVDLLLGFGSAPAIRQRIRSEDSEGNSGMLHVPQIFELEVLSVLRRLDLSGDISEHKSLRAIETLSDMRLIRYPHTNFIRRIWDLRNNVTTYDASYIVLAETLGAPLITTDGKLARSSGHRASIELF